MKEIGMIRKLDELGRVVIPMEVRRMFSLSEGDYIAFSLDEKHNALILKKRTPSCVCCHSEKELNELPNHRYICHSCLKQLKPLS